MNTRREFLAALGLLLTPAALAQISASQTPAKPAAPTPVQVVQQYLDARAARDYARAYVLFSAATQQQIPFQQFADGKNFDSASAHADEDGVSPLMAALSILFMDSHDAMSYQFTIIGPEPGDPNAVQVRAQPPGTAPVSSFLLKIATTPTADARSAPRIEMLPSYQKTSPADFERMREKARGIASLSNLRQIGLAILMYVQDHSGRMPDAAQWVDQILPYLEDKNAAPSVREGQVVSLFRDPSAPAGQKWNYAFNSRLSGLSLVQIEQPSKTVLVFESTAGTKNAADAGTSVPHPGRHDGGSYYVSADGHAQWSPDPSRLNFAP